MSYVLPEQHWGQHKTEIVLADRTTSYFRRLLPDLVLTEAITALVLWLAELTQGRAGGADRRSRITMPWFALRFVWPIVGGAGINQRVYRLL